MSDRNTIGVPIGTRLQRIIRLPTSWRLWIATADFVFGTYLELHDNGRITNTTVRRDEGDDTFEVRPPD